MIKRIIADKFLELSKKYPVCTITGPRQSGKTTLCRSLFPKLAYVNLENHDVRRFAVLDPRGFLAKYNDGVILDEIQRAPELPSYIQSMVDENDTPGRFVLTGSEQFEVTNTINQSLAGRTTVLRLLPFSMQELYAETKPPLINKLLYKGFYPRVHDKDLNPTEAMSSYVATYIERDIRSIANLKDLVAFEQFLGICAANVGQLINYSRFANDCGVDQKTVQYWLSLLEASYIIFRLPPHFRNFRKRITKSNKLYFYDTGLACYFLRIFDASHLEEHPLKGALFENFVVADLLKQRYNAARSNNLFFFRDHVGNEVDVILDYGSKVIPVEIKLAKTLTPGFFKGLSYYQKLDESRSRTPTLIYGGDEDTKMYNAQVFSYRSFEIANCGEQGD